jgi:excisionase family DNA binding protein
MPESSIVTSKSREHSHSLLDILDQLYQGRDGSVIAPRLCSITQAAYALGIGATECKTLIRTGALASCKIGARRLVPVSAIDAYVASLMEQV